MNVDYKEVICTCKSIHWINLLAAWNWFRDYIEKKNHRQINPIHVKCVYCFHLIKVFVFTSK